MSASRSSARGFVGTGLALLLVLLCTSTALAAPRFHVDMIGTTTAAPGGTHDYFVMVHNVGDAPADGSVDPLTLQITLPPGITAQSWDSAPQTANQWDCSSLVSGASTVTCTNVNISEPSGSNGSTRRIGTKLITNVAPGASGVLTARANVTGGGAAPAEGSDPTVITADPPEFGIDAFDGQVTANADGDPFTQAAGHPYAISTAIFFNTTTYPIPFKGSPWPVEAVKDVFVDLPPGLVGAPTATGDAKCTLTQLSNSELVNSKPLCPPGSQVGVTSIFTSEGFIMGNPLPVYNMVAPPDVPARFGFNVAGSVVTLDAALRSGGDYGLTVNVRNIPEGLAAAGTTLTFWGTPADPSHDLERACPGKDAPWVGGPTCATEQPRRAFLRNPTSCTPDGVGLETKVRIDSWVDPGDFKSASFVSHVPPDFPQPPDERGAHQGPTGCADVPFEPSFKGAPKEPKASAPSGFSFDLSLPQSDDPDRIGTADLKKAVVTLPAGVRVSPSSAAGLGACAPVEIALHTDAVSACPGTSKIGTVQIDTPLLDEPLAGSIYLAKPKDNPFSTLLSVYLVAKGPGLFIKLAGRVEANAVTGQLTATFDDNPQLPFSNLHLEFKGGDRAALVNPAKCGTYTTHAVLTSWSGATAVSDSSFAISRDGLGAPCARPRFSPSLSAGGSRTRAGKSTSFTLRLARADEDEELRSLTVRMPQGLLAKVAGVPLCDADTAGKAGTCGEGSRVGDVLTGAGPGATPFYLPGRVYLTDAYNGGPFGLSIVVPAVAGPFDLGTVVVRASVRIDRRTSTLSVVSDPLPTILEGIPLQLRDVRVTIDRPRFMVNPTSCLQKRVEATVGSTEGTTAKVSSRFQVGGCSKLKLRPRLSLTVGSRGHTRAGTSTPLTAKLTQTPGQSNLKSVAVTLPLSLNALLPVVEDACTQAEFEARNCEKARTGSATVVTPLLDKPLRGSAYFVKRPQGGLPNLVVALRGQVSFDLVGRIVIPGGVRLATKFETVPDVPIRSFVLRMSAGKDGAVGVAENLCTPKSKRAKAKIVFEGQNGGVIHRSQRLRVRGCEARVKAEAEGR